LADTPGDEACTHDLAFSDGDYRCDGRGRALVELEALVGDARARVWNRNGDQREDFFVVARRFHETRGERLYRDLALARGRDERQPRPKGGQQCCRVAVRLGEAEIATYRPGGADA